MSRVKQLRAPMPTRSQTPRCEQVLTPATEHERKWRLERYSEDPFRCTFPSTYEIDGHHLCTRHAGPIALRILSEMKS